MGGLFGFVAGSVEGPCKVRVEELDKRGGIVRAGTFDDDPLEGLGCEVFALLG